MFPRRGESTHVTRAENLRMRIGTLPLPTKSRPAREIQLVITREHRLAAVIMTSLAALVGLLLAVTLCCGARSWPANRRHWFYGAFKRDPDGGECAVFEDHPCNDVFNRTADERYAKFPNSRGMTMDGSLAEFAQYYALLNARPAGCYLEMWTLLCFHYFPQCRRNLPLKYIATPCREICEQARSGCENFLLSRNVSWPEHLECDQFNSSHHDHICVNSSADSKLANSVNLGPTTEATPNSSVEITTATLPDNPTPSPATDPTAPVNNTPEPTTSKHNSSILQFPISLSYHQYFYICTLSLSLSLTSVPCHTRCRYRTRANGGTFRNNDYTFGEFSTLPCSDSYNT